MKNKRYVEGSICDAYLVEETTHFAPFYFEDNVQSRRTQIGQNLNDGGIDTSLLTTLSVFNRPGHPIGAKGQRYLNNKERFAAHQYILLNYEEVQPILRLYETGLRQYNPGVTDEDIDNEVERILQAGLEIIAQNPIWRNLPPANRAQNPIWRNPPWKQSSRPQRNLLLQTELKTADTNRHVLPPFATVVGTTVASCQSEPHLLLCRLPKEKNN
nr:uncharacterized protein LOC109185082 [Ipomoea batatas]